MKAPLDTIDLPTDVNYTLNMQGKNKVYVRSLESRLRSVIAKKHSALLFGPRQVGKTTLIQGLLRGKADTLQFPLQNPEVKLALERDPGLLIRQLQARRSRGYVFVDEAQKVPALFDAIQYSIDEKLASFLVTGSSARKLRRKGANLLPGRVKMFRLDPFSWSELGWIKNSELKELKLEAIRQKVHYSFAQSLVFGSLPGIVKLPNDEERREFLKSYAQIYLEEEIRAEALSRKIGAFSIFLELAAQESGTHPNLTKLSMEAGVSVPALKEFFQVLEDTLIVEQVRPYLKNARKRILSLPRYYFFDLGVRNALARLPAIAVVINAVRDQGIIIGGMK